MGRMLRFYRNPSRRCLDEDELSRFIAGIVPEDKLEGMQSHLADCERCRGELAGVARLLYPDEDAAPEQPSEPSEAEIAESYELVRRVALEEGISDARIGRRPAAFTRAAAAAVLLIALAAGALGWEYLHSRRGAQRFVSAAIAELEPAFEDTTPSGLRLDLPFRPSATKRTAGHADALERSRNLFYQALALREGSREARLGLGAVYLAKSEFGRARDEFDKLLRANAGDLQALLGRGVAGYEEALAAGDPAERVALMRQALADFDAVLARSGRAPEARYNRIRVLYDTGRHREALAEIASYLEMDGSSLWATRMRDLKLRIELARPEAAEEAADRAAAARDRAGLEAMVRLVPDRIPGTIQHALRLGLEKEGDPAYRGSPSAADFLWAAETLAASYADATGDEGYARQVAFYRSLPAGLRAAKRSLDARLKDLADRYRAGEVRPVLGSIAALEDGYRKLRDTWQLAAAHYLKGNCLYYLARFTEAEGAYRETMKLARQTGSLDLLARSLAGLDAALSEQRRLDDNLACNTELKELARAHRMEYWTAYASRNLGNIYLLLGRLEESMQCHLDTLLPAYRMRDEVLLVNTLENLGLALEQAHRLAEARTYYDLALQELEAFSHEKSAHGRAASETRRLNLLAKHADLSLRLGDLGAAEHSYFTVVQGAGAQMPELACRGRLGLAAVRLAQGRPDAARRLASASLASAEAGGFADIVWRARALEARLLEREGRADAALESLEKATAALEKISQEVPAGELRYSFVVRRMDPYREIVALLIRLPGGKERARYYADRAKAMVLRDWLALQRAGVQERKPTDFRSTSHALPPGHALLEYFFIPDGLVVFVSKGDASGALRLGVRQEFVADKIDRFLESAERGDRAAFESLARELGRALVEPALAQLGPGAEDALVICPDGPLYRLPFAGLQDGRGMYLAERHAIAYAPARSVFEYCLSLARGDAGSRARSVLLVDGGGSLPGARSELAYISSLYGANAMFPDSRLPADRQAAQAEILHFAGHAFSAGGKPVLSLSPGRNAAYVDAAQVTAWRLERSRLVNLSACSTGAGVPGNADMPWGLAPAFLNAGAPALMVSLMPVDDRSARELNRRFYDLLIEGATPKARALQKAQSALISEMRSRGTFEPIAWLPFILIGDPR